MPYGNVILPRGTPPDLERVVRDQIDPILSDVHAMFRLPVTSEPGLEAGCNLSIALVLLELVGGMSTQLYDRPEFADLDPRDDRSKRC